jgi:hypothetical protein
LELVAAAALCVAELLAECVDDDVDECAEEDDEDDDPESVEGLALATAVPPNSAAPTPTVAAPAPSQLDTARFRRRRC